MNYRNRDTPNLIYCMTCFDDESLSGAIVLANSMFSKLCCSYKRNKDLQKDIEDFDYSLDCIWISKSIKQLKDVTDEIMQQIPKFEGKRLPSCHSIIKDKNHSVNDRSHNYSINSVAPMISIREELKIDNKVMKISDNGMLQPHNHSANLRKPDMKL